MNTTRRDFLALCSVLGASLASCAAVGPRARFAAAFVEDPDLAAFRPIVRALITAILPLEDPAFPVGEAEIEAHLLKLFPLDNEKQFLALQKTLVLFDALELFEIVSGPLIEEERKALDCPLRLSQPAFEAEVSEKRRRDAEAYRAFVKAFAVPSGARFVDLPLDARRQVLALWGGSEFVVKREFRGAIRALVLTSTYSMDRMWPSIGYPGPLIHGPAPETGS